MKRAQNKLEFQTSDLSLTSPFIEPIIYDIFDEIQKRKKLKSAYLLAAAELLLHLSPGTSGAPGCRGGAGAPGWQAGTGFSLQPCFAPSFASKRSFSEQ